MLWLVEYDKGLFVDARQINWLNVKNGKILFTQRGDIESCFPVGEEFKQQFLNHVGAINENLTSIESRYNELSKDVSCDKTPQPPPANPAVMENTRT